MTKLLGALQPDTSRCHGVIEQIPGACTMGVCSFSEVFMRHFSILAGALFWAFSGPVAQAQSVKEAQNVQATSSQIVHLSASASTQVLQDWMVMTLSVQKEGVDAATVQKQIKGSLASALALAQASAKTGLVEVSTGQLSVSPRYGRDGKTNGWVGTAELVMQGRDIDGIAALSGRVQGMTVSQVQWLVSPELKRQTENRIQGEAVAQFRSRASALASSFGSGGYDLKEVRVSTQESSGEPVMRMAAVQMDAPPVPMPVQAGSSRVAVNVSGSIQLK